MQSQKEYNWIRKYYNWRGEREDGYVVGVGGEEGGDAGLKMGQGIKYIF